jgi:hypothetical protein
MSRQHPWRADNPDAVIVARPSKWGNPWAVGRSSLPGMWAVWNARTGEVRSVVYNRVEAFTLAVGFFATDVLPNLDVEALAGRDLCCWCPLDGPCHADVLLEIANRPGEAS